MKLSLFALALVPSVSAFAPHRVGWTPRTVVSTPSALSAAPEGRDTLATVGSWAASALLSLALLTTPAWAENELAAKYGGGLDTSLVDQSCLVQHCSLSATTCLQDDAECRKGLVCTAKCVGDNACITGCMARYGGPHLDDLLHCTIEEHECIKVAILPGGADALDEAPLPPAPTVVNFAPSTLLGSWYKVVGFNPNYDCYACQRNSFDNLQASSALSLGMNVEFSMPHLLPDGSPPPPSGVRETIRTTGAQMQGSESIALNDYHTHETMVFDKPASGLTLVRNGQSYARTAHSQGEMFGLSKYTGW
jgi:VDE lipocalin domain